MEHDLEKELAAVGIMLVGWHQPLGFDVEFHGTEATFVEALTAFMKTNNWQQAHEDWWPGDPGGTGEDEYYLINDDGDQFCISYDALLISDILIGWREPVITRKGEVNEKVK